MIDVLQRSLGILEVISLVEETVRHPWATKDMKASESTLKATLAVPTSKEGILLSRLSQATLAVATSREGILFSRLSQAMEADRQLPANTHPLSSSLTATAGWGKLQWELWAAQPLALRWVNIMGIMVAAMANLSTRTCFEAAA
ncbi:hypothetical protein COCOBI_11-1270 [Coccomyxa sp. Obi]|nr:hypothetical protein COCOBI_11-1270 [Coccomyxa sp. Obi]